MNVSMYPYRPSMAIARIEKALRAYSPSWVTWTHIDDAEFVIFPVIGRHDQTVIAAENLKRAGREYAIIQLALKSTRNKNPHDWLDLWKKAVLVWSYYALPGKFNFYHSPLGADPEVFHPMNIYRQYVVGMTGAYTRTECLWEIEKAARMAEKPALKIRAVDDSDLNRQYNQCQYISGLRHKEGFELPAAEGMLAGARPILFDTPDFRHWYDGIAEFIPESNVLATINQLIPLFIKDVEVSNKEILYARYRFDWKRIITEFWERCL